MPIELYEIKIGEDTISRYMPLQFALILIKAIYTEFYNEPNLKVTIEKMERTEDNAIEMVDKNE